MTVALQKNHHWAQRTAKEHPSLFPALAKGQQPAILWIGCADSRVPETTILGLQPGDVFVHRNIANILHPGDISAGAVIEYAVAHLKVKHIIVCGHTSCGGVNAALGNSALGIIDPWLLPLRNLRAEHAKALSGLSPAEKTQKLVEENVLAGVKTVRQNSTVIAAVKERGLTVHAMVYDISTGRLKELDSSEDKDVAAVRLDAFETSFETS